MLPESGQQPTRPRGYLLILISALFLLLSCKTDEAPSNSNHHVRDISNLLEQQRKAQNLPAVAAIVINGDKIAAEGVAGVRKLGSPERAHLDDRWHLGSCTKAITATMIGVLVEQGSLSWETTIAEALPHMADAMRPEYRDVTIEMLLAHRGRIGHEWDVPGLWDELWKRESTPVQERNKMALVMLNRPPKVPPGKFFYSNCGYGIAGHMAEVVMGKPWEELVRELVFEPLGMTSAGFGVPWDDEPPSAPWPHNKDGKPVTPGRFADNPPSIGPGGTAHASIGDWAKFVAEHLQGAKGKNGRLLKAETYARLHKGQRLEDGTGEYALGWKVLCRPWAKGEKRGHKGRCLNHAGSNNSWYSLEWIAPERDFAVIATTNMGGEGVFHRIDAVVWAVFLDHINTGR
ncbi:serine hydrolase domain-containing protein [Thermodesulfobacteriota bacterium]